MSDELDAKLARISARMDDRAKAVRDELSAIGALALAELCRDVFGARLTYLKTPRVEFGTNPFPHPGCVWTPYFGPLARGDHADTQTPLEQVPGRGLRSVPKGRKGKPKHPSPSLKQKWHGGQGAERASGDDSALWLAPPGTAT